MDKQKPYPGTQAVLRAVSLLKAFRDDHPRWGLTELSQEVGLNKTTTYRLLTALASEGMVSRDPATETYQLGPEIVALAGRAMRTNDLRSICRPELEALAAETGETASLEILAGHEVLILDEVLGDYVMSGAQSIGTRWPAHTTSTGKAILACLTSSEIENLLPTRLPALTPKTVTDIQALHNDMALTRRRGYAIAAEELELGLIALGAPLRNYDGVAVAAISITGPVIRLQHEAIIQIGELVRTAAGRISAGLGFEGAETLETPEVSQDLRGLNKE